MNLWETTSTMKGLGGGTTQKTWFSDLFRFHESRTNVHAFTKLVSTSSGTNLLDSNGCIFQPGTLEVATLRELRARANHDRRFVKGHLSVREVVADVRDLYSNPNNEGAFFQVASQFNLLEMISPDVTPENGITCYQDDPTQGPASAMACAAGTLLRNWYHQPNNEQIDCLDRVSAVVGNRNGKFWKMKNGYAMLTGAIPDLPEKDETMGDLKIGIQHNTEVTLNRASSSQRGHCVTQAFCSALPISYSRVSSHQVEPLAKLVLDATYEATLAAATSHAVVTGKTTVYLTLVGGGAFGNPQPWILEALQRACNLYSDVGLDVVLVSYGRSNPELKQLHRYQRSSGGQDDWANRYPHKIQTVRRDKKKKTRWGFGVSRQAAEAGDAKKRADDGRVRIDPPQTLTNRSRILAACCGAKEEEWT